jgi:hypothetical protein
MKDITLSVLGYRDEGENAWVALALEMDLRGYGSTFDEAVQELNDLVGAQISFARLKNQPEMIWKPAEAVYWRLFEEARRNRLQELVMGSGPSNSDYAVGDLPLPDPHVIASLEEYQLADA